MTDIVQLFHLPKGKEVLFLRWCKFKFLGKTIVMGCTMFNIRLSGVK